MPTTFIEARQVERSAVKKWPGTRFDRVVILELHGAVSVGWQDDGEAWIAPLDVGPPVVIGDRERVSVASLFGITCR